MPHEEDGAEDPISLPATARGYHPLRQAERMAVLSQEFAQGNVFHEVDFGEAAYPFEEVPQHEDSLISRGYSGEAGSPVHQAFDNSEESLSSRKPNIKSSPARVGGFHSVNDETVYRFWECRVGVKKEKDIAFRDPCPGVELPGTATMTPDDVI